MPRFDIAEAFAIQKALSDFTRLNQLDDLWTLYLDEPGKLTSDQIKQLEQIVIEMLDLLKGIYEHASFLQKYIVDRKDICNAVFVGQLRSAPITFFHREQIESLMLTEGGFVDFAVRQLDILDKVSSDEIDALNKKIDNIQKLKEVVSGDLSQLVKCALQMGIVTASVAFLVSSGVALVPGVMEALQTGLGLEAVFTAFPEHKGLELVVHSCDAVMGIRHLIEKGCFKVF